MVRDPITHVDSKHKVLRTHKASLILFQRIILILRLNLHCRGSEVKQIFVMEHSIMNFMLIE